MKLVTLLLLPLLLASCNQSPEQKFERSKQFFNENSDKIKFIGESFYNQNSCVSVARVNFGFIKSFLGNEVIYHFFSVEKSANNFSIELPDANVENELEYWDNDFSLIKNRHDSLNLREFLVDRNIDSSIFKDCIDFLITSDLQLINKPPGSTTVLMKFKDGSGFIYYPEIDSHHTFEERGWKLDDHWYYYDENY